MVEHPKNAAAGNLKTRFKPTMIQQIEFSLRPYPRGYHLITGELSQQLPPLPESGLLNVFIKHTSAGLTINENADPSVRVDFESIFNKIVPENMPFLTHTIEGPDDMPAHIKAALVGSSVMIPISNHRLVRLRSQRRWLAPDLGVRKRSATTTRSLRFEPPSRSPAPFFCPTPRRTKPLHDPS